MLKVGEVNNCTKCHAQYSTYKTESEGKDDYLEVWSQPIFEIVDGKKVMPKTKGVCQFHNPKSKYFLG